MTKSKRFYQFFFLTDLLIIFLNKTKYIKVDQHFSTGGSPPRACKIPLCHFNDWIAKHSLGGQFSLLSLQQWGSCGQDAVKTYEEAFMFMTDGEKGFIPALLPLSFALSISGVPFPSPPLSLQLFARPTFNRTMLRPLYFHSGCLPLCCVRPSDWICP